MKTQIDPNKQNWWSKAADESSVARQRVSASGGIVVGRASSRAALSIGETARGDARPTRTSGSAMLGVMILALVVGGAMATYLLLVSGESKFVARSQSWNNAMPLAESGIEEALACINKNVGISGSLSGWTNTADGWDTSPSYKTNQTWKYQGVTQHWKDTSGTIYHIRRYLDSTNGYYDVYINNSLTTNSGPEILSIGSADWTTYSSSGNTNVSVSITGRPTRKIYLQTLSTSQGGNDGVVANSLTFDGNNVTIDSFDSSSSLHSIWKTNLWFHGANYGTWTNNMSYNSNTFPCYTANVHVAAETNYINVGNANVYGYIKTAPGGTDHISAQGSVGDLAFVHGGSTGLQTGHFKDDMNQTFTSLSPPLTFSNYLVQTNYWLPVRTYTTTVQSNSWLQVTTGGSAATTTNVIRIGGVFTNGVLVPGSGTKYSNVNNAGWVLPVGDGTTATYDFVIPNRPEATKNIYYAMDSIPTHSNSHGGTAGNLYVDSQYAVLWVTNGMSSPILTINTNSDLFIYCGGDITFGTTVNNTALARALTICDIKGKHISITASGNASGVAKLYVPSSNLKFNGGGNNTYDIIGEITGNSVEFNGHFNLHFDESLATNTIAGQFVGVNWREVQ